MALVIWDGDTDTAYTTAGNWAGGSAPSAADDVILEGSNAIAGSDQSGTAIDKVVDRLAANIGSNIAYLQLDPDDIEFDFSSGVHYVDIGSANIDVRVKNTSALSGDTYGLYLIGSDIATLVQNGGAVAVGGRLDESATVATVRVKGSSNLFIGTGVTLTTLYNEDGSVIVACNSTTANIYSGSYTSERTATITTLNIYGGTVTLNSTGTITTINHYGGILNAIGNGSAKTITTYNSFTNGSPKLITGPSVTITNFNEPTTPFSATWQSV